MRTPPFLLFLIAWLLVTASAHAQDPNLSRNAEAVERGAGGLAAFRAKDWDVAYREFHAAESLAHSPVFLLYMARARTRQGALAEALDLYVRVSNEALTESAPEAWHTAIDQARFERDELLWLIRENQAKNEPTRQEAPSAPLPVAPQRASTESPATRSSEPAAPKAAAIAAAILGTAGLVLGAVAGIRALVELEDIKQGCTGPSCRASDARRYEDVQRWGRLSDLGFVVAGTGFTTAAVFLWVVPAGNRTTTQRGATILTLSTKVQF